MSVLTVPIGGIIMWPWPRETHPIPSNYMVCDGQNGSPDLCWWNETMMILGAGGATAVGDTGGDWYPSNPQHTHTSEIAVAAESSHVHETPAWTLSTNAQKTSVETDLFSFNGGEVPHTHGTYHVHLDAGEAHTHAWTPGSQYVYWDDPSWETPDDPDYLYDSVYPVHRACYFIMRIS